mmetsp:Transcript_97289/g.208763  ORF Transcript_97289/g.208763 Transcript_97289/m.208763 type:complete len:297 (-) Transcript_97289:172-1062(-)
MVDADAPEAVQGAKEVPLAGIHPGPAAVLRIELHVLLLGGDPFRQTAVRIVESIGVEIPGLAEPSQISKRMAEGAKLPIQHRHDAGLFGMHDEVPKPEIAVRDHRRLHYGGRGAVEVSAQLLHALGLPDEAVLGGGRAHDLVLALIVASPRLHLALGVVAHLAETLQAKGPVVERVQLGQHTVRIVVERSSLLRLQRGQCGPPVPAVGVMENTARHVLHDVKVLPKHRGVLAKRQHLGHGYTGALQGPLHTVLPVHLVGPRQQLAWRLLPQHELLTGWRHNEVRGIGGAVVELLQL